MKKLLTIITLAALTITATFATTDNRDIKINGAVKASNYEFALSYDGTSLNDESVLSDSFDLSTVSTTKDFIVQRTSGNLNDDLGVTVTVDAGSFIGEFNGEENYDTDLYPQVNIVKTGYTYRDAKTEGNAGKFGVIIDAGANLKAADLAAFNLTINGDSSIPAGDFVSTVSIAYTYEQ